MSNPNPPVTPAAPDPTQVQQVIEQVQQNAATAANGGIPLEVKLETGQIYRGTTPQEVLDQLIRAQTEASRTITNQKSEVELLRSEVQTLKQSQQRPQQQDDAKAQNYYTEWSQKPGKANLELLGAELGIDGSKTGQVLKEVVEQTIINSASQKFAARHPEFPASPQAGTLMKQRLAQKFGTDLGALTADNLELTYLELVREGQLQPNTMTAQGFQNQNQPLPTIRGGSMPPNPVTDILQQAQSMPLEQLREVINRLSPKAAG